MKGARIIHDEQEKMIYFEQGPFEFFGMPIAYFPYFSTPDPTVKRKSGWLMPVFSSGTSSASSLEAPYFWALAPNYDVTLTPSMITKQGPFMQAEFRHRADERRLCHPRRRHRQFDKDEFIHGNGQTTPGYRDWRGAVESNGLFGLNRALGLGLGCASDFGQDLLSGLQAADLHERRAQSVPQGQMEGISQLYLTGRGDRSFFDARASTITVSPNSIIRNNCRSFIRSSTTPMSSTSRCSAANSALTPT